MLGWIPHESNSGMEIYIHVVYWEDVNFKHTEWKGKNNNYTDTTGIFRKEFTK